MDMWRFTPQSIDYLFPHVLFDPKMCAFSTRLPGREYSVEEPPELKLGTELRSYGLLFSSMIRVLRKLAPWRWNTSEPRLLVECNLMMIGRKQDIPSYTFIDRKHC